MAAKKLTQAFGIATPPYLAIKDGITGNITAPFSQFVQTVVGDCKFSPDGLKLAAVQGTAPQLMVYNTGDWSKINSPAILPAGTANGVAWSPGGSLLAVANNTTPFITIYDTTTWAKLANPAVLPPATAVMCAFNHNGTRLAVAHNNTPWLTVYDTTTWAKQADPAVLPGQNPGGVAYNHDGSRLVITLQASSPWLHIYNTADMSKLANPAVLPPSSATGAAFSPDGSKLAIGGYGTPFLRIYKTSDWSSLPLSVPTKLAFAYSQIQKLAWKNNTNLLCSTNGSPGIVEYAVGASAAAVVDTDSYYNLNGIAVIQSTGWKIDGTIDETLAADTWQADAYDYDTGAILGSVTFTGTAFSIPVGNPTPVKVTVSAKQGTVWEASKAVATGSKKYPTNPQATPFYFNCTAGGTTAATEPSWPVTAGGTVVDGTVTWQLVERLIEPSSQGPVVPVPA